MFTNQLFNVLFLLFICIGAAGGWVFIVGVGYDAWQTTMRQLEKDKRHD